MRLRSGFVLPTVARVSELPDTGAFGAVFEEFMLEMSAVAQSRESEVARRLSEHLGTDQADWNLSGNPLVGRPQIP